ncbi:MAG: DMT family transporter [Erysipelotrichaceae bacterium]
MDKIAKLKLMMAMLIFGSIGIFIKNIDLPSTMIVLWRTMIGSITLAFLFVIKKQKINKEGIRNNFFQLIFAGIVLGGEWVCLFESYRYISVSMATLLYYCAPILVFLFAAVFFKEKITLKKALGILAAMIGMLFLNGEAFSSKQSIIGLGMGILAALLYASLMITNKAIKNLSGLQSTFIQMIIAFFIMMIYTLVSSGSIKIAVKHEDLILLLIVGVVHTGIACYWYFSSMQVLPSQTTSILSYIDPTSALLFSAIFLNERLTTLQIIGAVFILAGMILQSIHFKKGKNIDS